MEFPDHTRIRYWSCFSFILVAYLCAYGALLIYTDFLPYILDNNESFSAFVHGENLYKFGLSDSLGLTDEAYGPNPGAHPYVYTHQGNFPRLFTVLLYALGFRTVESQIAITTFTIGLGTVYLIYHLFARLWNPTFALIVSLVFMSDYLLFAQWQMNTFKVWHAFFVFFSLVCVHHFYGARERTWSMLLVLSFAAILYYDLMMAVFTFVLSFSYACVSHYKRGLKSILKIGMRQAIGAVVGVGILITQLIAYYGWQTFKTDLYLTFVARNRAAATKIGLETFEEFFVQHKIVFWYNFIDGSAYAGLKPLIQSAFGYGFAIYTPYLAFLVLLIFSAIVVAFHRARIFSCLHRTCGLYREIGKTTLFGICAVAIAMVALLWPSKILLFALQILFILLLIVPVIFPNRYSMRRLAPALALCRRYLILLIVLPIFLQNILLLHAITHPIAWQRYSPQYLYLPSVLSAAGILFVYLLMRDYNSRNWISVSRPRNKSSPLEIFRGVDDISVNFLLYFSIGLFLMLAVCSYRFELTTGWVPALAGFISVKSDVVFLAVCVLLATGFALALTMGRSAFGSATFPCAARERRDRLLQKMLLFLFFMVFSFFGWTQHRLYFLPNISMLPIWDYVLAPWSAFYVPKVTLTLAAGLACFIIQKPLDSVLGNECRGLGNVVKFLFCVLTAYVTGYFFAPGYTSVINLQRYSPLLVFFLGPLFGATLYMLFLMATRVKQITTPDSRYIGRQTPIKHIGTITRAYGIPASAGAVLVFFCLYWISVQAAYFRLFPPTYASFLKKLEKPPYRDASFVTSTYAAPTAVKTGQWAYLDPLFLGVGQYVLGPDGYRKKGTGTYLWLADRDNPAYEWPRYAICHMTPDLTTALTKIGLAVKLGMPVVGTKDLDVPSPALAKRLGADSEDNGCGRLGVPRLGKERQGPGEVRFWLRERDPSPLYSWAIVELESDFPPYLAELTDKGGYIGLALMRRKTGYKLSVSYNYRQQQGNPEGLSEMKLFFIPTSSGESDMQDVITLYDGPTVPTFDLDKNMKGYIFAAVTPRSASRTGRVYVSDALRVRRDLR